MNKLSEESLLNEILACCATPNRNSLFVFDSEGESEDFLNALDECVTMERIDSFAVNNREIAFKNGSFITALPISSIMDVCIPNASFDEVLYSDLREEDIDLICSAVIPKTGQPDHSEIDAFLNTFVVKER